MFVVKTSYKKILLKLKKLISKFVNLFFFFGSFPFKLYFLKSSSESFETLPSKNYKTHENLKKRQESEHFYESITNNDTFNESKENENTYEELANEINETNEENRYYFVNKPVTFSCFSNKSSYFNKIAYTHL